MSPFDLFSNWYRSVCSPIPDKVILSTCNESGFPSSRLVLLKKYDETGFIFFTNFCSKKMVDLQQNNNASLLFYDLKEKTILIHGTVEIADIKTSDEYFATRNRNKQISAWSSNQSQILNSEEELEKKVEFYTKKFMYKKVPRPNFWGGVKLIPNTFEFIDNRKLAKYFYRSLNNIWIC